MERTSYIGMLVGSLLVFLFIVSVIPLYVYAQAGAATANAQCQPADEKNGHPCQLGVAGGTQIGICQKGICVGQSSTPGKGAAGEGVGGGGVDSSFVQNFLKGIMDKLMQGGQGGGSGGSGSGMGSGSTNNTNRPSTSTLNGYFNTYQNATTTTGWSTNNSAVRMLESFNDAAPSQTGYTNESQSSSNGLFISNFIQGFNQPSTNVNSQTSAQTNGPSGYGTNSFRYATPTAGNGQQGNSGQNNATTASGGYQTSGDINWQGNIDENQEGVSIINARVDASSNTGVAGFFGLFRSRAGQSPEANHSLFGRLCEAKPWEASLITRIFSSRFFDSLCISRMEASGESSFGDVAPTTAARPELQCTSLVEAGGEASIQWTCPNESRSSGIGFSTNAEPEGSVTVTPTQTTQYTLQCAQGGARSCVVRVNQPRAELVAYPERVALGARTRLYWVSEGVSSCTITGSGLSETALRGAVTTGAILDATTYTITCSDDSGESTVTDSVTVEVGP